MLHNNNSIMTPDTTIKLDPEKSVLKPQFAPFLQCARRG